MSLDFGLIGKKLSHSFSKSYFTDKFQEEKLPYSYQNFELGHASAIKDLVRMNENLRGFNVTIPYKTDVIRYLDELSPVAEKVAAVNTIHIKDGKMTGYNTDVVGFRDSLMGFYDDDPGGKALILGTGGASKAVVYVLKHFFFFDEVRFASRTPIDENHISYPELSRTGLQDFKLIINATPVGMFPEQGNFPDLPYESLGRSNYLYDLVYNPEETEFLKKGRQQLCRVKNGMEMLVKQAEASWKIWTN